MAEFFTKDRDFIHGITFNLGMENIREGKFANTDNREAVLKAKAKKRTKEPPRKYWVDGKKPEIS